MRSWLVLLVGAVGVLLAVVVLHEALVAGARMPNSLGRLSAATCATCHGGAVR